MANFLRSLIMPVSWLVVLVAGVFLFAWGGVQAREHTRATAEEVGALVLAAQDVVRTSPGGEAAFQTELVKNIHIRRSWLREGVITDSYHRPVHVIHSDGRIQVTFDAADRGACVSMLLASPAPSVTIVAVDDAAPMVLPLNADMATVACSPMSTSAGGAITWSAPDKVAAH
jgi:hypothetical protein